MMRMEDAEKQLGGLIRADCKLKHYTGKGLLSDYVSLPKLHLRNEIASIQEIIELLGPETASMLEIREYLPDPLYCVHPLQLEISRPQWYENRREYQKYVNGLRNTLSSAVEDNRPVVAFIGTENLEKTLDKLEFLKEHEKLLVVPTKGNTVYIDELSSFFSGIGMILFLKDIRGEESEIIGEIGETCVSQVSRIMGIPIKWSHPAVYSEPPSHF